MEHSVTHQDPHLIARVGAGDPDALEILYDRHARAVYSLLYRQVGDRQTAEDLLQETFVRAWEHATTFQPTRGRVLPWLLGIAHNLALNEHRHRRRRPQAPPAQERETAEAELANRPGDTPDPAEEAWRRQRQARLGAALAGLPAAQRAVIDLYATGYTQQEIATMLREPLGSVKSRMRRGLLRMREVLGAQGMGPE